MAKKRQPEHRIANPEQAPVLSHGPGKSRGQKLHHLRPTSPAVAVDQLISTDHQFIEPVGDAAAIHAGLREREIDAQFTKSPWHLPGLRNLPILFQLVNQALILCPTLLILMFKIAGGHGEGILKTRRTAVVQQSGAFLDRECSATASPRRARCQQDGELVKNVGRPGRQSGPVIAKISSQSPWLAALDR
jgi:hypothetical protein